MGVNGTRKSNAAPIVSSLELFRRARDGDAAAADHLFRRYLPCLMRWAHGRLPAAARGDRDTGDVVQEAFVGFFQRQNSFEPRHEAAVEAYLRSAILNRIRDEFRRIRRNPPCLQFDEDTKDLAPSPLSLAIGQQAMKRYESSLRRLRQQDRKIILLRVELGMKFEDLASTLGKRSAAAARMAFARALERLAQEIGIAEPCA